MLAGGQLHLELLDKSGNIAVADHRAFVFLHVQNRLRHHDFQVFLHLYLASQAPVVLNLLAGKESNFGGQNRSAAFHYTAFALAARAFATTGRRQIHFLFGQRGNQRVARRDGQHFVVVDGDFHLTFGHEFVAHP